MVLLGDIVKALGGSLQGSPQTSIQNLAPLETAGPSDLSFLSHPKYQTHLTKSRAACVVVTAQFQELALTRGACIVTEDPYLYFARLTQFWKKQTTPAVEARIHPSAVVDPEADIADTAIIGPLCVVERGAKVGAHTQLKSRVTLGEACEIGQRCIVHSGVVIGADGFGFAPDFSAQGGEWVKIPQTGAVAIGNDVEIGACTTIDRGAMANTTIGHGCKIDNQVQIAHNVSVGAHTVIAGCAAIAGSTAIGNYCVIGGNANFAGHLTIADRTTISGGTAVIRSITEPGTHLTGVFPSMPHALWEKNAAILRGLDKIRQRIRDLEKKDPKA